MRTNDFRILSTLPEEYDYEILSWNGDPFILGTGEDKMIGFVLIGNKLEKVNLGAKFTSLEENSNARIN